MQDLIRLILAVLIFLTGCGASQPAQTDGYGFTYEETRIEMHAQAQPLIDALGEPEGYTESPSCAFDGMDKTYYFGSFYLTTYPKDGIDYVSGIWFADDTVQTEEGLCIGDSQARVEEIYGSEGFNGSNAYTLKKGSTKLTILLTDGKVSSVLYEAKENSG